MPKLKIPDGLVEPTPTYYEYKIEPRKNWYYLMVRELPDGEWEHYRSGLGRIYKYSEQEKHLAEEFIRELTRLFGTGKKEVRQ